MQGNTDVTACWFHDGQYSIVTGYNPPKSHTFVQDSTNDDSFPSEDSGSAHSGEGDLRGGVERSGKVRMDYEATGRVDGLFHCK